jgi:hypothetical protein
VYLTIHPLLPVWRAATSKFVVVRSKNTPQKLAKIHTVRAIFGLVYCCFSINVAPEAFKLGGLRS